MAPLFGHETALKEMEQLGELGVFLVIHTLLEKKKLDWQRFCEWHYKVQSEENEKQQSLISRLALHLAYSIDGKDQEQAKKLLWETGLMEGSIYGERLRKEFESKA